MLPRLVRRASGLDHPSPEAVAAGVVRGITVLAPNVMGRIGGTCVELAGAATVLALATWIVRVESDDETYEAVLAGAIADVERRGLCHAWTASLWRATVGLAPLERERVWREALELSTSAARTISQEALLYRTLAWSTKGSHGLVGAARAGLRALGLGLTFANAWTAMGEAARFVEATRRFAAERAAAPESGAVVICFPSRAA